MDVCCGVWQLRPHAAKLFQKIKLKRRVEADQKQNKTAKTMTVTLYDHKLFTLVSLPILCKNTCSVYITELFWAINKAI